MAHKEDAAEMARLQRDAEPDKVLFRVHYWNARSLQHGHTDVMHVSSDAVQAQFKRLYPHCHISKVKVVRS